MRSNLAILALTGLTLSVAPAYAQKAAQEACGVETWSTDKMAYVSIPCTESQQQTSQAAKKPGAPNAAKCGVETWSTDKMAYESTPCAAGTTSDNPGAPQ
jgi:hypothetical protein